MLTIRPDQMAAFERASADGFEQRLFTHVHTLLREKGVAVLAPELRARISAAVTQAKEYYFKREIDIANFVEIVIVRLGGFDEKDCPKPLLCELYTYGADPESKLKKFGTWAAARGKA
jgi:hypothetical protein